MDRSIAAFFLCSIMLLIPTLDPPRANLAAQKVVTAAQVNGTWKYRGNEFRIWALGNQRLRVEFDGTYEYKVSGEWMANTGTGSGIATITGEVATFVPEGAEDDCTITLTFRKGKLIVDQEGGCGFGHNVIATGTYKKTGRGRPKFVNP